VIPVSLAPMMDRTDRHFRFFLRHLSTHTLLYTEMIHVNAILHGDRERHLGLSDCEHPVSLQLGGDDADKLAECAAIAQDYGYDEVNINVGCPSDRVQRGRFGACLMAHPDVVARAVEAMQARVNIPVTVKHRIGIDDLDQYDDMANFVRIVSDAGCKTFTVHARKAWLQGLSPKQNRNVPPLRYPEVYRLKQEFPHLNIEINGGIKTLEDVQEHLKHVDAVMIGRAAVDDSWLFASFDDAVFGDSSTQRTRASVARAMIPYGEALNAAGQPTHRITRHMLTLFQGQVGTRAWKRTLTEGGRRPAAEVIEDALTAVDAVQNRLEAS